MSGDTQVAMWMPLVIEVIGTSESGSDGQMFFHILRETWPCSALTALVTLARRMASTVMPNGSDWSDGFCRPSAISSSRPIFRPGR